jgi:hypothetical protein
VANPHRTIKREDTKRTPQCALNKNYEQETPYTYTAPLQPPQQQPQPQQVHTPAKPLGRLEKAKQLARKINDTENGSANLDRSVYSHASTSPASSYASSFSPNYSSPVSSPYDQHHHHRPHQQQQQQQPHRLPNSVANSAHSSTLSSPAFSTANSDSSRFNFPAPPTANAPSPTSQQSLHDSVASLLPLYITQYLTALQALNANTVNNQSAQSSLDSNDYLQSLTSAIYALTTYSAQPKQQQQQQSTANKPHLAEKRALNGVAKSQTSPIPMKNSVKYPTILIEDKENVSGQVEEHFRRSLGADYRRFVARSERDEADERAGAKKMKRSHSHTDLVIDESERDEEDNRSELTASYEDTEDSVSSVDSASCYKKVNGGSHFVDSHFSKALGQSVWSTLKAKCETNSTGGSSPSSSSSLNQSFEE